jgi:hypothetical protein
MQLSIQKPTAIRDLSPNLSPSSVEKAGVHSLVMDCFCAYFEIPARLLKSPPAISTRDCLVLRVFKPILTAPYVV